MDIQDISTHMNHGEIRLFVHLDLLDEPKEDVIKALEEMGYFPTICRYTWHTREAPDVPVSAICALLLQHISPSDSEAMLESLTPQWEQLEERFGVAAYLVRAGGKSGHNLVLPTEKYEKAIAV